MTTTTRTWTACSPVEIVTDPTITVTGATLGDGHAMLSPRSSRPDRVTAHDARYAASTRFTLVVPGGIIGSHHAITPSSTPSISSAHPADFRATGSLPILAATRSATR